MLNEMARRLKSQGIDILAVSVDQERANVDKFLRAHGGPLGAHRRARSARRDRRAAPARQDADLVRGRSLGDRPLRERRLPAGGRLDHRAPPARGRRPLRSISGRRPFVDETRRRMFRRGSSVGLVVSRLERLGRAQVDFGVAGRPRRSEQERARREIWPPARGCSRKGSSRRRWSSSRRPTRSSRPRPRCSVSRRPSGRPTGPAEAYRSYERLLAGPPEALSPDERDACAAGAGRARRGDGDRQADPLRAGRRRSVDDRPLDADVLRAPDPSLGRAARLRRHQAGIRAAQLPRLHHRRQAAGDVAHAQALRRGSPARRRRAPVTPPPVPIRRRRSPRSRRRCLPAAPPATATAVVTAPPPPAPSRPPPRATVPAAPVVPPRRTTLRTSCAPRLAAPRHRPPARRRRRPCAPVHRSAAPRAPAAAAPATSRRNPVASPDPRGADSTVAVAPCLVDDAAVTGRDAGPPPPAEPVRRRAARRFHARHRHASRARSRGS